MRPKVDWNVQKTVATREELLDRLAALCRRRVVLFDKAPYYHVAMYMMPVGQRTVLVGDPRLAQQLLNDSPEGSAVAAYLPQGPDFTDPTIASFDAVAKQCQELGYKVVRIPVACSSNGQSYVTYLNVIQEQREGRRIVYMPTYDKADSLNKAAAKVWTEQGFEVHPVDCTECARSSAHFTASSMSCTR